jgi:prephenate dehydrogenase
LANREALLTELEAYQSELNLLQKLLENKDGAGLEALFESASNARNAWAKQRESQ